MKAPRGKLIPIGGNEARDYGQRQNSDQNVSFDNGILKEVLKEITSKDPVIEVLTIASKEQKKLADDYKKAFKKLGYDAEIIVDGENINLDSREKLERLGKADCLLITGGDQLRLKELLNGTKFLELLKRKYLEEDFIIAGTSAGAMIMSGYMIDDGECEGSLLKGIVTLSEGINLLPGLIIDTHFLKRGRLSRIIEALLKNRDYIGVGLCEDTAVVISNGNELRSIGSGSVTVLEPFSIKKTNYESVKEKDPVFVENLKIHFLAGDSGYDLKEKKFLVPEEYHA